MDNLDFVFAQRQEDMKKELGISSDSKRLVEFADHDFKADVLTKIAKGEKDLATEMLVKRIMAVDSIFAIRDDMKVEAYIYRDGVYRNNANSFVKQRVRSILGDAYTEQFASRVLSKIYLDTFIDAKDFFKVHNPNRIAVANGLLDFKEKKLYPFTPTEIHFMKLPVMFDQSKECPTIKKHFNTVLRGERDILVMQELCGYFLLRDTKFEIAFMFLGDGRNGKGKTLILFKDFLGAENCTAIPLQEFESDQYSVSNLLNKLANLGGDLSPTALRQTGKFKSILGRDNQDANRKFLPRIQFIPFAVHVYSANQLPITYDKTLAFFNRWGMIDFPFTFYSKAEYDKLGDIDKKNARIGDPDIVRKMTTPDELSGLLNWALEGLSRLLKQGTFSTGDTTQDIKNRWIRKSDSFAAFCMDHIKVDFDAAIPKDVLRIVYSEYCRKYKLIPTSDYQIKKVLMEELGVSEQRILVADDRKHAWMYIGFKENVQTVHDVHTFSSNTINSIFYIGKKPIAHLDTLDAYSNEAEAVK